MDKKLTPIEMVAREMADHSTLSSDQIDDSIRRALTHMKNRAANEIVRDDTSDHTRDVVHEYQALSEMINFFGSQLIAFEDLEIADADRIKN
jgi:hypothetical protein